MNSYIVEQKSIIKQNQLIDDIIQKGGYCNVCGFIEEPLIIQNHHIAGKNNDYFTIPVCPNCHTILSLDQRTWDEDWIKKNNTPRKIMAFMLRGISDILKLISSILKKYSDEMLNGED